MTSANPRFPFDKAFDDPKAGLEVDRMRALFNTNDIEAARTAGYEAGRQAALTEHKSSTEQATAETLARIEQAMSELTDAQNTSIEETMSRLIDAASAMLRKLMPELTRLHGMAEIESCVVECARNLVDEPRIVVRVADGRIDGLQASLDRVGQSAGFTGQVVLVADPDLGPADCRVEWADGGTTRDTNRIRHAVDDAVQRALHWIRQVGTEPENIA